MASSGPSKGPKINQEIEKSKLDEHQEKINATSDGKWGTCHEICSCNVNALSISCDHANLQHIPANLPKNTKVISMNGNDFTIIDKDFAHLHQLRSLDLQRSKVQIISPETFKNNTLL